ncbi:MAG: prepilin-type N-terminal cleavage/methylation domain-containing protein [Sedimentisphaerales bacterium]|nr:prepilin-type N-terminal cleavage/methylation domain-containing protein [Sedimentisphaerales bacterium]
MEKNRIILESRAGFSLAEVLAAMMIGSMVLIAVLTVYNRAERTAAAVTHSLNDSKQPSEVLQLIIEDLDKIISTDSDTNVIVVNRFINNYKAAILAIQVHYKDPTNKDQQYEEIIWQCSANPEGDANDMVLYRSREGIAPADNLLEKDKEAFEKSVYVPICRGVTFFEIKVYTGEDEPETFLPNGMPLGLIITISFAEPFKSSEGRYEVLENEKYTRTIAVNKNRKIKFNISEDESSEDEIDETGLTVK